MPGGDAESTIDRRKIIDAFFRLQIAPVKAIVFKPGVRILFQRRFLAITIVETGHADAWVRQQTGKGRRGDNRAFSQHCL